MRKPSLILLRSRNRFRPSSFLPLSWLLPRAAICPRRRDGLGAGEVPRASRPCRGMAKRAVAQGPCHGRPAREGAWPGWPRLWKCRKGWLAAALVFTAAALLSKESGMVLPVLICCNTWIYGAGSGREVSATEKAPSPLARAIFALVASIPFWLVVLVYVPAR